MTFHITFFLELSHVTFDVFLILLCRIIFRAIKVVYFFYQKLLLYRIINSNVNGIRIQKSHSSLTLSWRRSLPYRNQSIDLLCKSMHWFLYDRDFLHERDNFFTGFSLADGDDSQYRKQMEADCSSLPFSSAQKHSDIYCSFIF